MSGLASSDAATSLRIVYDTGRSAERPVSNCTPARISGAGLGGGAPGARCADTLSAGANSSKQPLASTLVPGGVPGHLSTLSGTPSPSASPTVGASGHPVASTLVPGGVVGHLSRPSGTPSTSPSSGQPLASTVAPAGVAGH